MVNKVILVGRLGKDPEVRYLDNQRVVAVFPLATNEVYIDKNGDKRDQTEWHNIELWDGLAKNAEKVLRKGRVVYIEGKIRTEAWTDKEGNKRYTTRVRALQFQLISSPDNKNASGDTNTTDNNPETVHNNNAETIVDLHHDTNPDPNGDLPF